MAGAEIADRFGSLIGQGNSAAAQAERALAGLVGDGRCGLSTTPPTTIEDALASIAKLTKALDAEREAHKTTKNELSAHAGNAEAVEKIIADRLAPISKERDDAKAHAVKVAADWDSHRIEAGITQALGTCGLIPENNEDAANLIRPLLTVDPKTGQIVTKEAPNVIAGMSVDQHIHAVLKAQRPHWWPSSIGGGARGGSLGVTGGDTSVFDPASHTYSVTAQAQYERRYGIDAARRAAKQFGQALAGEGRGGR